MKTVIAFAVAAMAASAVAQTNNFTFDLRIAGDSVSNGGSVTLPATGGVVSFWLQGRSTATSLAAGQGNFGVGRATTGPAGQTPSFITVTDMVADTRLGRGTVGLTGTGANAGTPLTGRGPLFRTGGTAGSVVSPWHSATQNGSGGALFPSSAGNLMGAFDQNGDRLYGFDSYGAGSRPDTAGENPYIAAGWTENPIGQASQWYNLYRFDVLVSGNSERTVTLNAAAFLSAYVAFIDLGGSYTGNISSPTTGSRSVTSTFSFNVVPTPGAAALVGLGALAAGRRRR